MTIRIGVDPYDLLQLSAQDFADLHRLACAAVQAKTSHTVWSNFEHSAAFEQGGEAFQLFLDAAGGRGVLYAQDGALVVGEVSIQREGPVFRSLEEATALVRVVAAYQKTGEVPCASCGKPVNADGARAEGRSLYAGVYCEACSQGEVFRRNKAQEGA